MDWNLETTWDFTDFVQEVIREVDAVDGGSSSFGGTREIGNFSVDLKLGQVINLVEGLLHNSKEPGVSKMKISPSESSKRANAASIGCQP